MGHKTINVAVRKLFLDKSNSRHERLDNEPEIIERLVREEKAMSIAKSIATVGELNPLEAVGVIQHPDVKGSYVVIEGNRRVCALKLLHDPEKAPTYQYRERLKTYLESGREIPNEIEATLFDTEEEAAPWISMRHEGAQDGVGTREWSPAGKDRHAAKVGNATANSLALKIIGYSTKRHLISQDEANLLSPTTLTRYLSNPIVRHTLGLTSGKDLQIDVDQGEFDKAIEKFLRDALPTDNAEKPKVSSRTSAEERKRYAKQLASQGHAPTTRTTPSVPIAKASAGAKRVRLANPDTRSSIVGSFRHAFAKDKILIRIFKELHDIDAHEFGFAAAYLLRAFVERLSHLFAEKHRIQKDDHLHVVIGRCVAYLDQTASGAPNFDARAFRRAMKPLRTMASDKNSRISPETLGGWVHGGDLPTKAEINRRWEVLEPGMKLLADSL